MEPYLESFTLPQLEFEVQVDDSLLDEDAAMIREAPDAGGKPTFFITAKTIGVKIPEAFQLTVSLPDNTADKLLLKSALSGLALFLDTKGIKNDLTPDVINRIIDSGLANPQAKMLLFSDASRNVKRDARHLPPRRYVQSSDVSHILDNLVANLPPEVAVPQRIASKDQKVALCTNIVRVLLQLLETKIAAFDGFGLVRWLIQMHERYIFEREFREILIPARIACFSDVETEMNRRLDGERDLASTGHALRTLMEFVASRPPTGTLWPNFDDIDELIALTNQVTEWGALEESIRFGFDNPEMGLLPSGRMGTDKSFERRNLREYAKARVEGDVFRDMEDFEKNYYRPTRPQDTTPGKEEAELDQAFLSEHGITFQELHRFASALVNHSYEDGASFVSLSDKQIIRLATETAGLPADRAKAALAMWTLVTRPSLATYPTGYSMKDIMTWHFNRDLSAIRRPLARIASADGQTYLYGYRHIVFTLDHLIYLLYTAKYPDAKSPELLTWLAGRSGQKGNPFRQEVFEWFQENTALKAIPYEINMKPNAGNGHLRTDQDYGDLDLAVIDPRNKIFYSLECKNVNGPRNIHEMKVELDNYLGRTPSDPDAKMLKHVRRHQWLTANKAALEQFIPDPETYEVRSIVLTADELSLAYLGKKNLPLPIRSFLFLRKQGISYLSVPPVK